tara:strand:- start:25 stop:1077 length:1053 start_codon:yes stop_codon:yes gene_type:complete
MDAEDLGSWLPFAVAFILITSTGWAIWNIPEHQGQKSAQSGDNIPFFVEHFPNQTTDLVPIDQVLRIAWHPDNSELGVLKTPDRYIELGQQEIVEHSEQNASAKLNVSIEWSSKESLNITVDVSILDEIENGIIRIIVIEDGAEVTGRISNQYGVVCLYDPTPITNNNGTITRELQLPRELSIADADRLRVVTLLSNLMNEENYALLEMSVPIENSGPESAIEKVYSIIFMSIIIIGLAWISRSEWRREVMLPKLRGGMNESGDPIAHLRAGRSDILLKEVRILEPWKSSKSIREIKIPAQTEKKFTIQVKPIRGQENISDKEIQSEWSIDVDELGGWVLDLTLQKRPPV